MRKIAISLLALSLTAALVAPAGAVSLLSETFTYADGSLVPNGGWTTFSGSGTDIQIVSGVASGNSQNGPDDSRGFAAQSTTAKTYYCMNLTVPAGQPASTGMTSFAFLLDATTTNFFGRAYLIPAGATNYTLGLSPGSCNAPACTPAVWPGTLNLGQTYVVTVSYDAAAGSSELWVQPSSELSPKITTSVFSGTAPLNAAVQKFGLREGGPPTGQTGTANWQFQIDNVGVGTSFDDACASGPVPTNSNTWGRLKTLYRN